ncbi:MAG: glycosyltransferase family 2 protein [Jaaginema sp. PMC 1078.18]|nr:glycosyltransferase family 2 protein [Jaaginema sp. PMC 1078.18]
MVKFSIVITTYNRLALLKRAIASALEQTIPCEVIVVDDASTDETQDYIAALETPTEGFSLSYYRHEDNQGHSQSVNRGVEVATGDWIKLLDDDDYLAPNCIEVITQALALHPEAVICSCQAAQVDTKEVELRRTRSIGPGQACYIPQEDIHHGMLLEQVPFGTPVQVAFQRQAFLKTGGWDSGLDANFDDIDSWIKLACHGDAIFINQCLAYRTIWPGGLNQRFSWQERLSTNIAIKQKIYPCIHDRHRATSPALGTVEKYLHLHWGLAALKNLQVAAALSMLFPAMADVAAWQLLWRSRQMAKSPQTATAYPVRKQVLIESL